jgi:hypothetical protein
MVLLPIATEILEYYKHLSVPIPNIVNLNSFVLTGGRLKAIGIHVMFVYRLFTHPCWMPINFIPSIHLCAWNNLRTDGLFFMKCDNRKILGEIEIHFNFNLDRKTLTITLHEAVLTYL